MSHPSATIGHPEPPGSKPVTLWRCETCGKFSFARRRPHQHRRFVPDTQLRADLPDMGVPDEIVAEWVEPAPIAPDDSTGGGVFIFCGPFRAWTATRSEPEA